MSVIDSLAKLKEILNEKDVILETAYNTATLIFPDGSTFTFEAEGCEGTYLALNAKFLVECCVQIN